LIFLFKMVIKNEEKKVSNVIAIFAILIIIVAVGNLLVTYIKVTDFREEITGYALGTVNLTIGTQISINVSGADGNEPNISWGVGNVDLGETNATLETRNGASGNIARGNWSGSNAYAIVILNDGNLNASINVSATFNASELFGSASLLNQAYMWNFSDKEINSCRAANVTLDNFYNVNKTAVTVCENLEFNDSRDEVWLNIRLDVPYDAQNTSVALNDTITISAFAEI
jgi:hypothetical protein